MSDSDSNSVEGLTAELVDLTVDEDNPLVSVVRTPSGPRNTGWHLVPDGPDYNLVLEQQAGASAGETKTVDVIDPETGVVQSFAIPSQYNPDTDSLVYDANNNQVLVVHDSQSGDLPPHHDKPDENDKPGEDGKPGKDDKPPPQF